MYKALIFDLGKVLIPFDFQLGYQALGNLCPYSPAEIPRRIATTDLVQRFDMGLMEPTDFVNGLCELLQLRADYDSFCRVWNCIFTGQLIPDRTLAALRARYRMLLLSNTNLLHFKTIRENYSLLDHFDELVLSFQLHALKPQPEMFRAAVARAGCRPAECFFTDDIAANVEAARREGIDAVQFTSAEQLEQEMKTRGITW